MIEFDSAYTNPLNRNWGPSQYRPPPQLWKCVSVLICFVWECLYSELIWFDTQHKPGYLKNTEFRDDIKIVLDFDQ